MTPPKDQAPGLIERLRAKHPSLVTQSFIMAEAADMIEKLEAGNAELRGKVEKAEAKALTNAALWCRELAEGYRNSPAKVEALRAAEQEILRSRAALTEQANIRSPVESQIRERYNPEDDK